MLSSSEANCTVIYDDKSAILIDAGIGVKLLNAKLLDKLPKGHKISHILITHEHGDHIKGIGPIWSKHKSKVWVHQISMEKRAKYFERIPKKTLDADYEGYIEYIEPGVEFEVDNFKVTPFSTKHDSAFSVGFLIVHEPTGHKIGYLTDTGMVSRLMYSKMESVDTLFIEADYDELSLSEYLDYDELLKDRIRSSVGHLSNTQMAEAINKIGPDGLKNVVIGHLSRRTNSPELVKAELEKTVSKGFAERALVAPLEDPIKLE